MIIDFFLLKIFIYPFNKYVAPISRNNTFVFFFSYRWSIRSVSFQILINFSCLETVYSTSSKQQHLLTSLFLSCWEFVVMREGDMRRVLEVIENYWHDVAIVGSSNAYKCVGDKWRCYSLLLGVVVMERKN